MTVVTSIATLLAAGVPAAQAQPPERDYAPGRVIVKFRDAAIGTADSFAARHRLRTRKHLGAANTQLVEIASNRSVEEAVAALRAAPEVEYAQPDYVHEALRTPNDPQYSWLWGMHSHLDFDIDAPQAWDVKTEAPSVVVAVIDTGVDYTHPDLAANMWRNPNETLNGVDDDHNGYVDDIHGINCITGSGDPFDDNVYGHGTHVAGTIAATGNNANGVAGVAWRTQVMALKFLSAAGPGWTSDAIECINYAIRMRTQYGVNVRVTNNSWGGGPYEPALLAAIQQLDAAGILFVAAAGNNNSSHDVTPRYPADYAAPNVISVGALGPDGTRAYFSDYGPSTVDVVAPGMSILSTLPGAAYGYLQGTSMAAPHVAGVATLLAEVYPSWTPAEIAQRLVDTSADHPNWTPYFVGGLVKARAALGIDPEPPARRDYVPVAGAALTVKETSSKFKLAYSSSDPVIRPVAALSPADPRTAGASFELLNTSTGEMMRIPLEASGWRAKKKGYAYDGAQPCTASIAPSKLIIECSGSGAPFTLDEPTQGSLSLAVGFGEDAPFCAKFGGNVSADYGRGFGKKSTSGSFSAKKAPASSACFSD
jgi:subtilisin family serine protease